MSALQKRLREISLAQAKSAQGGAMPLSEAVAQLAVDAAVKAARKAAARKSKPKAKAAGAAIVGGRVHNPPTIADLIYRLERMEMAMPQASGAAIVGGRKPKKVRMAAGAIVGGRAPSAYQMFIKANYHRVRSALMDQGYSGRPLNTQVFRELGHEWSMAKMY